MQKLKDVMWPLAVVFCFCEISFGPDASGQDSGPKSSRLSGEFLRVNRDDRNQPTELQTSIVSYVLADGSDGELQVDLVGAIHIADKGYFEKLNEQFKKYDVLLYELVAPDGARPTLGATDTGPGPRHPLTALQQGMKDLLELEFQLECVDYSKDNFVHADMTPAEFAKSMEMREESLMQIVFRSIGQGIAAQSTGANGASDAQIMLALFSKDRAHKLKRAFASQFENIDGQMSVFIGPQGSTIITERNKKALQVLSKEIAAGRKRIGIFYGAGHLADMEKRLISDFQLKRASETWLTAWSLGQKQK